MSALETLPRAMRITGRLTENPRTASFSLDGAIGAAPGQFVMAWLPGLDEKPFSVSGDGPLRLTVNRVGPFSEALHRLEVGDRLWVRGPFGTSFGLHGARRVLLAGGGYGAAPLLYLAERLLSGPADPASLTAALGARTSDQILFEGRFRALGVDVRVATEDGSAGLCGRVTDVVGPLLEAGCVDAFYACGPEGMLSALEALCRRTGVRAELSREAYMRCGVGLCGSCEHAGGLLVCRDGPVFRVE